MMALDVAIRKYLVTVPERVTRSLVALGAGLAREVGEIALPQGVRRSRLYQNLVDATLRYLIEQVGGVEGVYPDSGSLPDDFLARRTAGNAIEVLGIVAFRASPVWILAALADLSGMGRQLIPEIARALAAEGLLDGDTRFTSVDQLLDGLERTSGRLASAVNAPPLDVAGLRREWEEIRRDARTLQPSNLPSRESIAALWNDLAAEAARQDRSVFETSSVLALSAARSIPEGLRWLTASARVTAVQTGHVLAAALLDHYRQTLDGIRTEGYLTYARRQLTPYVRASINQFSPGRETLTDRVVERLRRRRGQQ